MKLRTRRIIAWILCVILAVIFAAVDNHVNKEMAQITVNAPADMENAFRRALEDAGLKSEYEIVMNESMTANIVVSSGKADDPEYMKFAFSPFVIGYDFYAGNYYKQLKKSNVMTPSEFDKNLDEIDFQKVISEVIEEGKWSNLGVGDLNTIKVFYPSEDTEYWHDFYDFMLVTVNGGKYPEETEMKNAEEAVQRFLNSSYTESVTDFSQQVERTGGFTSNAFWILPEKEFFSINRNVVLLYPKVTVYCNFYVKGDELGKKLINAFDTKHSWDGNFYSKLYFKGYRNQEKSNICGSDRVNGKRDVYNVAKIPENTTAESFTSETPTNPLK